MVREQKNPRLVELIEDLIAPSSDVAVLDRKGYSPRIQHIIETADQEAERFDNENIGTEHLLIALLKEADCAGGTSVEYAGCEYPEDLYRDSGSHGEKT